MYNPEQVFVSDFDRDAALHCQGILIVFFFCLAEQCLIDEISVLFSVQNQTKALLLLIFFAIEMYCSPEAGLSVSRMKECSMSGERAKKAVCNILIGAAGALWVSQLFGKCGRKCFAGGVTLVLLGYKLNWYLHEKGCPSGSSSQPGRCSRRSFSGQSSEPVLHTVDNVETP